MMQFKKWLTESWYPEQTHMPEFWKMVDGLFYNFPYTSPLIFADWLDEHGGNEFAEEIRLLTAGESSVRNQILNKLDLPMYLYPQMLETRANALIFTWIMHIGSNINYVFPYKEIKVLNGENEMTIPKGTWLYCEHLDDRRDIISARKIVKQKMPDKLKLTMALRLIDSMKHLMLPN